MSILTLVIYKHSSLNNDDHFRLWFVVESKVFQVLTHLWLIDCLFALLIHRILLNQQKPLSFRYDFIFDRCRAVRQEIVIQNFSCVKTVKLLEPIVMFLSFSLYRLNESPIAVFDPKICSQHLKECLLKCLTCYDEMCRLGQHEPSMENRIILEGIYLMLNVDDTAALQRAVQLNPTLKSSYIIRTCIQISINFHLKSYYKVLRDIQNLPHLLSAIASLRLPQVRKETLRVFSIAYSSSTLNVPIDFLQRLMIYDDAEILSKDLKSLGIQLNENGDKPSNVIFSRGKFDTSKSIVSNKMMIDWVYTISDLIELQNNFSLFVFIFSQTPHINSWSRNCTIIICQICFCWKLCKLCSWIKIFFWTCWSVLFGGKVSLISYES